MGFYHVYYAVNLYFSRVAIFSGLKRPMVNVNFKLWKTCFSKHKERISPHSLESSALLIQVVKRCCSYLMQVKIKIAKTQLKINKH